MTHEPEQEVQHGDQPAKPAEVQDGQPASEKVAEVQHGDQPLTADHVTIDLSPAAAEPDADESEPEPEHEHGEPTG